MDVNQYFENSFTKQWLLQLKVRLVQKIDTGHVYAMKSSQNGKKTPKIPDFAKLLIIATNVWSFF